MSIRLATVDDMPDVSELSGEVFAPYGDYRRVLPEYMLNGNVITFVSEVEGQFAGFIQISRECMGEGDSTVVWADILSVAVRPRFQNRGLGSAMLDHAMAQLEPMRGPERPFEIWLTVAHTNHRAIKLFARLGFALTGVEAGEYAGGQRALRMCRILQPIRKRVL